MSGAIRTGGTPGTTATSNPATTSSDGAGTRSRRADAATAVAITTNNRTISTLRTRTSRGDRNQMPTRLPGAPPTP